MDIKELQDYRLTDAIKFHNHLNPKVWGSDEHILPEVREKLLAIAEDFKEFLGLDLEVKDITLSGSNAAYTYTDHSDLDLHLVVDLPKADISDVYRELFDAKKYQYNDTHNYTIGGIPVELYVQNANENPESQGIYSLLQNNWLIVPKRRKPTVDDISVKSKYEDIGRRVEDAIASKDPARLDAIAHKIKAMRQSGLDKTGEFGPENLAFKILRSNGTLDQLRDARSAAKSASLSIDEEENKKTKPDSIFGGLWYPGYHYYGASAEVNDDTITPDDIGADDVNESAGENIQDLLNKFAAYCTDRLGIDHPPKLQLKKDPAWAERNATFGRYDPETDTLTLTIANRHPVDIMRTMAHELVHRKQDDVESLPADAGETGSHWENQANAEAGKIMRDWGAQNPELFDRKPISEATGYIPVNAEEARDPRYSMAITVDIKPGEVQRQAAKMGWKTDRAGHPQVARTNGLVESLTKRLNAIKESRGLDERIGIQLMSEDPEQLDEVNMSPGALADWAKSAGEMQSGFEAELIFAGLGEEEEEYDPEYEPDYSYDPRPDSIEEIIEFFQSGDFADLSDRAANRIRRQMEEEYTEWLDDKMMDDWDNDKDVAVREYLENTEGLEGEELKTRTDAALSDENRDYDNALEFYSDDWRSEHDEQDWLRSNGIRHMSDAENTYSLIWPHMEDMNSGHSSSEGGFNEAAAEHLADSLSNDLGVKTTVSSRYHSADRDTESWIFEPDGSLEGDSSNDMPVEIVSPPMPLEKTLEIMPKFFAWAEAQGAYANKSTGFHMSVSMPEHKGSDLDYIKLAVFLGDKYVIDQFGRAGNYYCVSAMDKIQKQLKDRPIEDKEKALANMRSGLNTLASQALVHASGFGKYVTINPKTNYVEFRTAGGKDYFKDMDKIQQTMTRYARALSLAMDPAAEKQEYAKKLYKTLTDVQTQQVTDPKTGRKRTEVKPGQDDAIGLFSRYVAGEMPKSALRSFLKQLQQSRETKRQAAAGEPMVWRVTTGNQSMNVVATGEKEAKEKALREWDYNVSPANLHVTRAELVGPVADTATPPRDIMTEPAADDPNGNYVLRRRVNNEGTGPIVYRFSAPNNVTAIETARQWTQARGLDRRSVWLDHISGVPPEVLNARPEQPAAPAARGSILPGSTEALTLQRAYPDVLITDADSSTGKWVIFSNTSFSSEALIEATSALDALLQFHRWMASGDHRDSYRLRPADEHDIDYFQTYGNSAQELEPEVAQNFQQPTLLSQTDVENRLGWGDQTADANYEIVDLRNNTTPVFKLIANSFADAARKLEQWLSATDADPAGFAVRRIPQTTAQPTGNTFTGRWRVVSSNTGETVYEFGGAGNRQADANRIAAEWAHRTGFDDPVEVYPVMQ